MVVYIQLYRPTTGIVVVYIQFNFATEQTGKLFYMAQNKFGQAAISLRFVAICIAQPVNQCSSL